MIRLRLAGRLTATLLVIGSLAASGCSSHDGRQAVEGVVTIDAQPLELGTITFQPVSETSAPSAGGAVENGRFQVPTKNGPLPGNYRIRIQAFRRTGRSVVDPQLGLVPETEPLQYQERDRLEATVVDRGNNHFEFQLTRQAVAPR